MGDLAQQIREKYHSPTPGEDIVSRAIRKICMVTMASFSCASGMQRGLRRHPVMC